MIWRHKDEDGFYKTGYGREWKFGFCPNCLDDENLMSILKSIGAVRSKKLGMTFPIFQCGSCDTVYIYNYRTLQLVEACPMHFCPIPLIICMKCGIAETKERIRKWKEKNPNIANLEEA